MRPKLNLEDKDQMSTPNEYTDNFKSNLTCIFPSVRAKLKKPLCPRTLCSERRRVFSLFLLLGEIRRVLSAKMASNQLKISQKIDLDSFQGID